MARKRVTEPQLKSWEEVDQCLKTVSDAENEISKIEAQMNQGIAELKKQAEEAAKKHKEIIKSNEGKIKEFTTIHKDELKGKSKSLTFGMVGFRLSTKLLLPQKINEVIAKLREYGMFDCIVVTEKVDKEAIKKYSEKDIQEVGGYLQKTDTFWYETDKEALAAGE